MKRGHELLLLGRLSAGPITDAEIRRDFPGLTEAINEMVDVELLEWDCWGDPASYRLTALGDLRLRVVEGRDCDWCHRKAVSGALSTTYRQVFFCRRHRDIGNRSAETPTSERGSLHGLIRRGKLRHIEPDEVCA